MTATTTELTELIAATHLLDSEAVELLSAALIERGVTLTAVPFHPDRDKNLFVSAEVESMRALIGLILSTAWVRQQQSTSASIARRLVARGWRVA